MRALGGSIQGHASPHNEDADTPKSLAKAWPKFNDAKEHLRLVLYADQYVRCMHVQKYEYIHVAKCKWDASKTGTGEVF